MNTSTNTQNNQNITNKVGTTYCGMSKRKFGTRFAEHRDYAKHHKIEEPSGLHFSQPGHTFHLIQGLAIEKVKSNDPFILKAREAWLIRKFDCYRNGLNKEP